MSDQPQIDTLESAAYAAAHSDGLIDLFFGISVAWIGAAWLWLPDFAALAGVFPAVLLLPAIELRKRIVEPRLGYVRWSDDRVRRERRGYARLLSIGTIAFLLGVGAFVWTELSASPGDVLSQLIPGVPSILIAIGALALGLAAGVRRAVAYAAILAGAGALTIASSGDPGLDLFTAGLAISLYAASLVIRFVRRYPATGPT